MIFYIDNKTSNKKEFSHKELIKRFIANKQAYTNYLYGQPFERCFLNVMPGTPEPIIISDNDWKALDVELKKQDPNPKFLV